MPYSSGTFSRVHDFTDDRDNGIRIQASRMDAEMDGIATGLSTALLKDGTQTATAKIPFAVGLSVIDNQTILLGTNSDIAIQYDETTNDSLEISANVEGAALGIVLKSDQGDDNADQHKLSIADGGTLTLGSKISGSFVSYLTHTPNSTVASSTLAVAGNLTVGGNLTLGSGAELSEAELEMLDGITAGTVAASKAVVVDANKDIASFRNVTLTGELDAATGDFSGDVDVDGTLEADAITVNGTALATVIAGTTVTTATNANHVSVADNESTNEENLIPFIEDASATGNVGLESDGDFAYNPSTGTVSATVFKGNIDAVDGDFDGTLEADAMTLNGTAITATATLDTGISNNNVPKFTSGVADDDFLRVNGTAIEGRSASEVLSDIGGQAALTFGISDTNIPIFTSGVADDDFLRVNGTSIEGRSASEVLSDIGASAVAGSSSIVTTGALNAGSITSGFGTIDTGSSTITTTGVGTFGSLDISGNIDVDGTTNLDVVDIDGAVDMASTLAVTGALSAKGGAVFNEDSADVDFRVESNGNVNMINLDGGEGRLGIGLVPGNHFHVSGGSAPCTRIVQANTGDRVNIAVQHAGATGSTVRTQIQFNKDDNAEVGSIKSNGSATSFNTSSDYRLKENVSYEFDATTRLKQLKPARFNFKVDADTTVDGFLAHEVSSIVPEAISGKKDATKNAVDVVLNVDGSVKASGVSQAEWTAGKLATTNEDGKTVDPIYASNTTWIENKTVPDHQSIDQSKLVPLLVKTIQELEARITALESA